MKEEQHNTKEVAIKVLKHTGSAIGGTIVGGIAPRFSLPLAIGGFIGGAVWNIPELFSGSAAALASGSVYAGATQELAGDDGKSTIDKIKEQAKANFFNTAKGFIKTSAISKVNKDLIPNIDKKLAEDHAKKLAASGNVGYTPHTEMIQVEMLEDTPPEHLLVETVTPEESMQNDMMLEQMLTEAQNMNTMQGANVLEDFSEIAGANVLEDFSEFAGANVLEDFSNY